MWYTPSSARVELSTDSVAELAADQDVIISMLPAGRHVREVYLGGEGDASSGVLANVAEGTLLIDIIDAGARELAWRGTAEAEVHNEASPEQRQQRLNEAITKILDRFPPQ